MMDVAGKKVTVSAQTLIRVINEAEEKTKGDQGDHAFGQYLKGLRDKSGLSLRDVEEKIGISNAYLSQLENGKRGLPSENVLRELARVYKVPFAEIWIVAGIKKAESLDIESLPAGEKDILEYYRKLPPDMKRSLVDFLRGAADSTPPRPPFR